MSEEEKKQTMEWPLIPMENGVLEPTDAAGLYFLARVFVKSGMAPVEYDGKPERAFVAMQLGASVGLNYLQSLQSIAVVRRRPTIYGEATKGLIQSSGLLEDHKEFWELNGEKMEDYNGSPDLDEWPEELTYVCIMKRKGIATPSTGRFSVGDAKRMGAWNKSTEQGKNSVWQNNPKDMLAWRAIHRAEKLFSDVLKGLIPREVAMDYDADLKQEPDGSYSVPEKEESPAPDESTVGTPDDEGECSLKKVFDKVQPDEVEAMQAFLDMAAEHNKWSLEETIADALNSWDDFYATFQGWKLQMYDKQKPEEDTVTENEEPAEETPEQDDVELKEPPPPADGGIESLRALMFKWAGDEKITLPENANDLLEGYISHAATTSKMANDEIIAIMNGDVSTFKYFKRWMDDQVKIAKANEHDAKKKKPKYSKFKSKWANLNTKQLQAWVQLEGVKDEIYAGARENLQDFKDLVAKWKRLVKTEFPIVLEEKQEKIPSTEVESNEAPPADDHSKMYQYLWDTFPKECEHINKTLKFAKGSVSKAAVMIFKNRLKEEFGIKE